MGRYVIEYGLPAFISVLFVWSVLKWWYLKVFPNNIHTLQDIADHSKEYDKALESDLEGNSFDGTIRNWSEGKGSTGSVIYGTIFGDKKGRFIDGTPIRTSTVLDLDRFTGTARTMNSYYKLEGETNAGSVSPTAGTEAKPN